MNFKYSTDQVDALVEKMRPLVSRIESSFSNGISLYGAGFLGTWACKYLEALGAKINHFIDRDQQKIGSKLNNVSIISPESEELSSALTILIASRHVVREVEKDMSHLDCIKMSFEGYFVCRNYERLAAVRDNFFSDDKSIETFNALLIAMITASLKP